MDHGATSDDAVITVSLAELGRELAAMDDAQLAAYLEGLEPEDLDALEQAVAAAEAEAGMSDEAARLAREHESTAARYARWWSDPAAFAAEALVWPEGNQLHGYQAEALTTLATRLRLVLRKLRGAGGSAIAAITVLWFAVTRDYYGVDWKIVTTASVQRQLDEYLWPEIHKWAPRLRWELLGRAPWERGSELLLQGIKLAHGQAFAASPGDASTIEGLHATQVLVVMDEAKGIRVPVFDALEGGATRYGPETGATMYVLALSTAGPTEGRFYQLATGQKGPNWARQHITLEEAVAAGQVSASSIDELRQLWGEDSVLFANHCLGDFKDDAANTVIPLAWVSVAEERWLSLSAGERAVAAELAGIDVAREGADRSILIAMGGDVAGVPVELTRGDGPTTAASSLTWVSLAPAGPLVLVDSEGVGASVYDAFKRGYRDLGRRVHEFRAGTASKWTDSSGLLRFYDLRSAAWWHLRELLDPALGATLCLPPHDKLRGDLTAPKWEDRGTRGIKVETKDTIRKRLGRSTDHGDALVMAAWGRVLRRGLGVTPRIGTAEKAKSRRPETEDGGWLDGDVWTEGV